MNRIQAWEGKLFLLLIFLLSVNILTQTNCAFKEIQYSKLERNQINFIGQPLREFIKTLDLPISSISYQNEDEDGLDRIILRFDSRESYNKLRRQNIMPGRITISFKNDHITKSVFKRLKNHYGIIESDPLKIKEFEHLIVHRINVSADSKIQNSNL